jgi:putative transposase
MAQSYTNLIYHFVFSTKNRAPVITPAVESRLYDYIGGAIQSEGGVCLAVNGMPDHVHILAKLRADKSVSDVLRGLKANAAGWMKDVFPELNDFSWQRGYGAFTVSASQIENVRDYIAKQKEHHKECSFQTEFVKYLRANRIEFDERYLWTS